MILNSLAAFLENDASYTSWNYIVLVALSLVLYYLLPKKIRWIILLLSSCLFYELVGSKGDELTVFSFKGFEVRFSKAVLLFYLTVGVSYLGGLVLQKHKNPVFLCFFLLLSIFPLLMAKLDGYIPHLGSWNAVVPVGLSFYSLQIYAYLSDVYHGKVECQKNPLRYLLFISFFPQILQGPIPRYSQLKDDLFFVHSFDYASFSKGFMLVLWGFFLKFMIADRAAVFVDTVFADPTFYQGMFFLIAGILYSLQLYTDFLACVSISRGVAGMFGITLPENFMQPYHALTVRDFWKRWHISLSSWLRDYVYIPLGGNRNGTFRRYLCLILTFLVSGTWHGNGIQYIVWSLLHAFYLILGDALTPVRVFIRKTFGVTGGSFAQKMISRSITFFLVMLGWIIFRADSLVQGLEMIQSIFTIYNPWILFDDSLLKLGLDWKEWGILLMSVFLLFRVEAMQEKFVVRDAILRQPLLLRWVLMITGMGIVLVFGRYGYGFNSTDFIYRGF